MSQDPKKTKAQLDAEQANTDAWNIRQGEITDAWNIAKGNHTDQWNIAHGVNQDSWNVKHAEIEQKFNNHQIDGNTKKRLDDEAILAYRKQEEKIILKFRAEEKENIEAFRKQRDENILSFREKRGEIWQQYGWSQEKEDQYNASQNQSRLHNTTEQYGTLHKPEALIREEQPIRGAFSRVNDEQAAAFSTKYDQATSRFSTIYDQEAGKFSTSYDAFQSQLSAGQITQEQFDKKISESLKNKDLRISKALNSKDSSVSVALHAKDVNVSNALGMMNQGLSEMWQKHGWSQEKEDAYDKQRYAEYLQQAQQEEPKPVTAKPKPTGKAPTESIEEAALQGEVVAAVRSFVNDSTWQSTKAQIEAVRTADNKTDRVNVLLNEEKREAVILSALNGKVATFGDFKPHPMAAEEISDAVKQMEGYIRGNTFQQLSSDHALEVFAKGVSEKYAFKEGDQKLTAILLDDKKHALIASSTGGYEIVDVKADAPIQTNSIGVTPAPKTELRK